MGKEKISVKKYYDINKNNWKEYCQFLLKHKCKLHNSNTTLYKNNLELIQRCLNDNKIFGFNLLLLSMIHYTKQK